MQRYLGLWLLALLAFGWHPATAQPVCDPARPGTLACQPQAVNPQLTDIVAATEQNGPSRTNQSVKLGISQILGLAGSTQYMPFSGGALTGALTTAAPLAGATGFNLPHGTAPSSPNNGDVWTTTTGLFVDINGTVLGPLGAGGGVNAGTLNQLAYYASAGNTLSGLTPIANAVLQSSGASVPSFSTTLPSGLALSAAILQPAKYANVAALPVVTSANEGQLATVSNCLNGTETGGGGTGCYYRVNNTGSWVPLPATPTLKIGFGSQSLALGQSATMQGIGGAVATWTGSSVSGNCVSQDANGTLTNAGVVCGGGSGGNGTVTAGTVNQLAFYSASGTSVGGLASANSAILITNGAGIPAFGTTLPASLVIPTPTISSPAITGTGSYGSLTGTGKLSTAAGTTTQAGLNVAPGVAPTTPVNGDVWSTTTGFFMRINGGTFPVGTGNGTITGVNTAGPLTGGGLSGTLSLACATCLTSAGTGGNFIASVPLQFNSATATLSLGSQVKTFTFNADQFTTVANATYSIYLAFPYGTGSIISVAANTGGASSPSFAISLQVAGGNIASCTSLTVSPSTPVSATCGSNTIVSGNAVQLVISGTNGAPSNAAIQVTYSASAV